MQEDDRQPSALTLLLRQPIVIGGIVLLLMFHFGNWLVSQRQAQASGNGWETDLARAKVEAAKTNKPIFIDFGADWCGWCQKMQNDVFPDPRVAGTLHHMICVHVDVDRDPDDAQAYSVQGIPRMIVLDPNLKTRMDITGACDTDTFARQLHSAAASIDGSRAE